MNLMSVQLGENWFYISQMCITLLLLFFIGVNNQNNFFILLRKILGVDRLVRNQEQILRPNLISYKIAFIGSK